MQKSTIVFNHFYENNQLFRLCDTKIIGYFLIVVSTKGNYCRKAVNSNLRHSKQDNRGKDMLNL